ncbi:hypothetical protein ACQY0O_001392 [Thecaphora frezii]
MLGFLRSASSSSIFDSAASADPNQSASSDRSVSHDDSSDDDRISLHSEDGDLSAYIARRHRYLNGTAPLQLPETKVQTPVSVLKAVRDQHPNLSVFRPSFTDKLQAVRSDQDDMSRSPSPAPPQPQLQPGSADAMVRSSPLDARADASDNAPIANTQTSTPTTVATTATAPSRADEALSADSPSIRAHQSQSKRRFILKPKKRASDPATPSSPSGIEPSLGGSGSIIPIQGLEASPSIGSSPRQQPDANSGRPDGWLATPTISRIRSQVTPQTPQTPQTPISAAAPAQAYILTPDASVRGILRMPKTPGTGSSVRFGMRLYDDGDESAMTVSMEDSPEQPRPDQHPSSSPLRAPVYEISDDAESWLHDEAEVDRSLSFGTTLQGSYGQADAGAGAGVSLTSSPHSRLSLSSLNGSPDHDQIQAINDLSTTTDEGQQSDSFDDSDLDPRAATSRQPSSSPTIRIPMLKTLSPSRSPSPLGQSPRPSFADGEAAHVHREDTSASRLPNLSGALANQTHEMSNLLDLSIDSMRQVEMDDTRSLSQIARIREASRTAHRADNVREPKSSIDSMPSSFGGDSSEASFSESFLREAGAGMLAGLDLDDDLDDDDDDGSVAEGRNAEHSKAVPPEAPPSPQMAETSRPAEAAEETSHPLDSLVDDLDFEDEATTTTTTAIRTPTDPGSVSGEGLVADEVEAEIEAEIEVEPQPERAAPVSGSPKRLPGSAAPSMAQPEANDATPVSAEAEGMASPTASLQTPTLATSKELPAATPGSISVATTVADWATPQWAGPPSTPADVALSETSLDRSLSSSAIVSSPIREKLARKLGDKGKAAPSAGQMVLRPGRLVGNEVVRLSDGMAASDSATADLEEIVAVIRQLDEAHTEHGSYLMSRVHRAEAKFALLSQALKHESSEKTRVLRDNAVARDKVQVLQDKIDSLMQEFEATKQSNQLKDEEVEKLILKLNGQLERRQRENDWQAKFEELQRQLDQEQRARASERHDWEVRLRAVQRDIDVKGSDAATGNAVVDAAGAARTTLDEEERQRIVQETREQTRDSCRRDFEIRSEIAQRESQQEIERLRATIDELEARLRSTGDAERQAAEEAQGTIQGLRKELDRAREEHRSESEAFAQQVGDLEDRLHEARREVEQLEQEVAQGQDRIHQGHQEVDMLHQELAGVRDQLGQSQEEAERLQQELTGVLAQLRQAQEEAERLERQVADGEVEVRSARQEAEQVHQELAASNGLCNELQQRLEREATEGKELRAELEQQANALEAGLDECTAELDRCRQELALAKEEHARVQTELNEAQANLRRREAEADALRAELEAALGASDRSFERKRTLLEEEAAGLRADCRASESRLEGLRMEKERVEAMLEQANDQRKEDLDAIAKLRLELDEAGRDKEDVLVSLTELEEFHAEEQARLRDAQSQVERLSDDKESLLAQLREAESIQDDKLRNLSAQLEAVSEELDASRAQLEANAHSSADNRRLQDEVDRLQARLSKLEHEVADRGLTIVKLTKAKEKLEEENTNYGIALSAKQLELSMLKRNARIALGEAASTPRAGAAHSNVVTSASRTATTATTGAQRSVLGALSSNAVATSAVRPLGGGSSGAVRRDERSKSTEEDAEAAVEAITLQKGPAALKATRRRTLDPATVINVGRLRPRPSNVATTTRQSPPQPPAPAQPQPPSTAKVDVEPVASMPSRASTCPLVRRASTASTLGAASARASTTKTATAVTAVTTKVSAATQARINRRQSLATASQASSRATSPTPSHSSIASSRRSSISSQVSNDPVAATTAARRRSLVPPPTHFAGVRPSSAATTVVAAVGGRSVRRSSFQPPPRAAASIQEEPDRSLSFSDLQSPAATTTGANQGSAALHRRLSAVPPPPSFEVETEGGTDTPRASRRSKTPTATPPLPERLLVPV